MPLRPAQAPANLRPMPTIHDVLGELRATSVDERDKGDKFERLIQSYLTTDPEWTAKFPDVGLWSEWPLQAGRPAPASGDPRALPWP